MRLLRYLFAARWLLAGALLGGALLALPAPAGLSPEGQRALAIAAVATLFFITEPLPLPGVALLIVIAQVVLGLGSSNEVARAFMSDSVFFIMGSLMISVALVKQKLDRRIAYAILRLTGPRVPRLVAGFACVSALLASLVGEHTVAAILLPVALAIVGFVREHARDVRHLAALLLFSISYGTAVGGVGTPSGGARNAIMIDYWHQLSGLRVGYLDWVAHALPLIVLEVPLLILILLNTFPPEVATVRRALARLRREVRSEGGLTASDWRAIAIFGLTMLGWIALGSAWGLGIVSLLGASAYLVFGLVRWEDVNRGVNWGVVLLYAAAISLGLQMKETGAADWLAQNVLGGLNAFHLDGGVPLLAALSLLTVLVTHTMSTGAAVAVLGPVALQIAALSGDSPLAAGFTTALASAFGYLVVASTPASMMVYSSGYLTAKDFLRVGARMLLASLLALWLVLTFVWPRF